MRQEQPEAINFESNLKKLNGNIACYYNLVNNATYACLVLHQHVGLEESLAQTSQELMGTRVSVMIPDLLSTVQSQQSLSQFAAVKQLKYHQVENIVTQCYNHLKANHSSIILMGFSIGAAYALKILETTSGRIQFTEAFLFYGLPELNNFNPDPIQTKCTLFYGKQDEIKFLSDPETYEELKTKCRGNKYIAFIKIRAVSHGFLNPESDGYSLNALKYCQQMIHQSLPGLDGDPNQPQQSECSLI